MTYNPYAATCPICGTAAPEPCTPDGQIHNGRDKASKKLANAIWDLRVQQDQVATNKSRQHRINEILDGEPFAIDDAVFNRQVLKKSPSRLATSPYPIVSSGRGFTA